jgi:hypothetical protein
MLLFWTEQPRECTSTNGVSHITPPVLASNGACLIITQHTSRLLKRQHLRASQAATLRISDFLSLQFCRRIFLNIAE